MIRSLYKKYAPLEALSFDNRSDEEKRCAVIRPTVPEGAVEHELLWDREAANDAEREAGEIDPHFERDIEAITTNPIHRRLSDMGQLAPSFSHVFQNRMSHTNHVMRVSEKLCKAMNLDEDSTELAKAIAYAHDIGHAPFSHEAEEVFQEKLEAVGGTWNHDYYGMRILTDRAQALLNSDGLPLTAAVLEGTLKRYRRFTDGETDLNNAPLSEVPSSIQKIENEQQLFHLKEWSHIEGQIVSISDWIAGTCSDFRDILLWKLDESKDDMPKFAKRVDKVVESLPLAKETWQELQALIPEAETQDIYKQNKAIRIFSKMLEKALIADVLDATLKRYEVNKDKINNAEDVRGLDDLLVAFSPELRQTMDALNKTKEEKTYPKILKEHVNTKEMMNEFYELVQASFEGENTGLDIAEDWKALYKQIGESENQEENAAEKAQTHVIIDYIATGFTDKDVMHLMKTHKAEQYEGLMENAKEAAYPLHVPPPTTVWSRILNLANNVTNSLQPS